MNLILFYILAEVNYVPYIIVGGGLFVLLIAIFVLIFLIRRRKKKISNDGNEWFHALGDKENVQEVKAIGSRLTVVLVNKDKMDRDQLKELGVSSILVMANKIVLVIENQAEKIANILNNSL